ncbi:MAG TPA: hypothetical protein VIR82_24435 [Bradyrhizobium sp.]|jgi:hypothetical protein
MFGRLRRRCADAARRVLGAWRRLREFDFHSDREARGLALLKEWLSPEQLAQYRQYRHFDVTGCHSGKRYRIRYGVSMNVCELDSLGRPLVGRCFVPKDNLVAGDVMLAQKIALETNERGVLLVAKTFSPRWRTIHAEV